MAIIRKRRIVSSEGNEEDDQSGQAKFDLVTELTDNMTELGKVDSREADQKTDYPVEQEKTVIIRTRQRRRPEASDSTPNDSSELTQQSEGTPIPEAFQQSAEMAETPRFEAEPTRFPFPIVIEAEAIDPMTAAMLFQAADLRMEMASAPRRYSLLLAAPQWQCPIFMEDLSQGMTRIMENPGSQLTN